jgi:diguanylate cyclase (GGDEF)-like protein/PAS domain S-box-containing protein
MKKDGSLASADLKAQVEALQRALQAAQDAAQRDHILLQGSFWDSPTAIMVSRRSDGRYVEVNHQWSTMSGYSREETLGRTSLEMGVWPNAQTRDATLARLRSAGARTLDIPFVTRDGRSLLLQLDAVFIDIDGEPHYLSQLTDVTQQRKAQAVIEENERTLQKLNDELMAKVEIFELTENLARVGHWTMADVNAKQQQWSAGLYALGGLTPGADLKTGEARGYIHPEDRADFVDARTRLDGSMVEYRWMHRDGKVHWMRSRMRRHQGRDGSYLDYGVVQDFTEEQEAKQALQDRLGLVQRLTSRLPEMVFQFARHGTKSGAFVFVSDAVQEVFRVSPEQAYADSTRIFRHIHPDDMPGMMRTMQEGAGHGQTWAYEFRVRFDDGTVRVLFGKAITFIEPNGQSMAYGSITDVTDHKASQASLRESEARFRALTELSSDWYWEQDAQFRLSRLDGALVHKGGGQALPGMGKTRWEIGALNMSAADWDAHRAVLESHAVFHDLELQELDYKGRPYWLSLSGAPFFDAEGNFAGYRGVGRNITGRKRAEEKIEKLAYYDVLTGLPNRRLLMDRLHYALATSGRDKAPGALLFIDLDNFKDLNDTQGHDVGDMLLLQVAQRLVGCVRETDTVARLGGDEFVVMLQSLDSSMEQATAQAERVGKKILGSLNQAYRLGALEHHSTPSIGIALFENQHQSVDDLLKQADLAMYESKSAGRNTMRFFDPTMQALVAQRTELEADLRLGLQRGELLLHYQPVVDDHSRVVGVEALVRWQHPHRGLVPPNAFISIAEQTGLILALGGWVLEAACKQLAVWSRQSATAALTIAVNVSARQFRHPEFVGQVMDIVRRTQARPQLLRLELTESLLLGDTQDTVRKMGELREHGVQFSLDDFGTGYSSLSYLKLLPLEQLKIDQSFVRDVLTDPNDAAIARTILALGQSLGLSVVAEGVETTGQRDFLLQSGCTLFQGYLFSKPVPVEQLLLDDPAAHI